MAFEPINIFSRRIDPRGVAELLRGLGHGAQITGPDDDWEQIVVTVRKGGVFRKTRVLTFGHDAAYYDGDDWLTQVSGMRGYFSRFPETTNKGQILRLIGTFRFSLSVPQHDLDIDGRDDRLVIVYSVCRHLDGVIFTPTSLRDAQGRILIGAGGESDPEAVMPRMPPTESFADEADDDDGEDDGASDDPVPPSPERAACPRSLAPTAVAARATLEIDASKLEEPDVQRKRLVEWVQALQIGDELEPEEWKVLQRPVGGIERQDHLNAMWRVEGLVVLAWALQCFDLPPDDELVVPADLYQAMGILDVDAGRAILQSPNLRTEQELDDARTHLLMLHWRLRDYSVRPQAMDFAAFSKDCWIGSFDIDTFRLIDNDLAIGDAAINDAEELNVRRVSSLAMERHLAINWLMGDSEIYSETDTGT